MITKKIFDTLPDGRSINEYIFTNTNGMEVHVISYACIIKDIIIPKDGQKYNVVLGWNSLEDYLKAGYLQYYFGSCVGRVANRIENSSFTLDGKEYHLTPNENGVHHLHGTFRDTLFADAMLDAEGKETDDEAKARSVIFSYYQPEEEEGYPGNLKFNCIYELTNENDFVINYRAVSDKDTIINITNHSYFNLNGRDSGDIFDHMLEIDSDRYTETDELLNPTGKLPLVEGTENDFRVLRPIGDKLHDENYCLRGQTNSSDMKIAAQLGGDKSGITMYTGTTEIGVQLYSGFKKGVCLETQHYPDSPNHPDFPSIRLAAGDVYTSQTIYKFEW